MKEHPFEVGDVVIGSLVGGDICGIVTTKPLDAGPTYADGEALVWAIWKFYDGWVDKPAFMRADKVVLHPDPDPVLVEFMAWTLGGRHEQD